MTTQIKLRRDTAANWTSNNPVLGLGEIGLETDTRKAKFGDGATTWTGLSYMVAPDPAALTTGTSFGGDVSGLYNAIVVNQATNAFALLNDVTITSTPTLDNYALAATTAIIRWNGAGALAWSGATGGGDGRILLIENVTAAQTLTLKHDVTSTAGNRFYCPNGVDFAIPPHGAALVCYDNTATRWLVFGAGGITTDAVWNAKGDLLVGTADNAASILASSAVNDQVLMVDTTTGTGLKWGTTAAGAGATYATVYKLTFHD